MRRAMVFLGFILLLSNLASAQIKLSFEPEGAVATGVTPGADAIWFGVSRDGEEWSDHFYHWRHATAGSENDGTITFPCKDGFPTLTVLVVIDLERGDYVLGTAYPREAPIPELDLQGAQAGPTGTLTSYRLSGNQVDVLVARRGEGAWGATVSDGGPLDLDGVGDGQVTIGFAALRPLGGKSVPLDGARPGDVVALAYARGPWVRVTRVAGRGEE
jgi:hypothetical protein